MTINALVSSIIIFLGAERFIQIAQRYANQYKVLLNAPVYVTNEYWAKYRYVNQP